MAHQRIALTITQDSIEKWRKDLRAMTKIYKSIGLEGTERDRKLWDEASKLFSRFRDNFEAWVYKVVLPSIKQSEQDGWERAIAKSAWNARYTISSLFPTLHDGTDKRAPNFYELGRDREKNIRRYQAAFGAAFKDLEGYLESKNGSLQRHELIETFDVGGMHVIVHGQGRDEDTEKYLSALHRFAAPVVRAGFEKALKGLEVTIIPAGEEHMVAGSYNAQKDRLRLFPLGLDADNHGTLVHEVGHRFWFKCLPGQARAHWSEVMKARGIPITKKEVDVFFDRVVKPHVKENDPLTWYHLDEIAPRVARTPEELAVFRELARSPIAPWDSKTVDLDAYRKKLEELNVGEVVQVEHITDYANTNPEEAWADAFRLWVTKGPQALGPWTRQFFKEIARAGGAKVSSTLAEKVARRWIAPV